LNTLRRIVAWVAPYRGSVLLASLLTGLACLLNPVPPLLVQGLIDQVIAGGRWGTLPAFAAALLGASAAQGVVGLAMAQVVGRVGQGVVRDLRHRVYDHLQTLSLAYYDRTATGAIISRLMDDVGAIQTFVTGQTFSILTDLGTAAVVTTLLLAQGWRLALVVLIFVPLYALNFRHFMRKIRATSAEIRDRMDLLFGRLKETLDGQVVVKAHAQEAEEGRRFRGQLDDAHGPRVREVVLRSAFGNLSAAISGLGTAAVFAVGAHEVLHGRMTPGGVVSTVALAGLLFGPIARLADLAYVFEQAGASVDRLGEILDLAPEVREPERPRALPGPGGRPLGLVEFDRVGFGYRPGEPVVWDVRLRIEPGRKVALVGPTGCGKTTLTSLLLRFYDPTWGQIRLDGVPIDQLRTRDLRRQIGVVLQEPVVFRLSVADNIRYGRPEATDDEVRSAALAALVDDFVARLPEGYDTLVGEGGHPLSQGERQRLAIARALCADPALVILDEATSSLDPEGEALIQRALANLLRGRTSILIAHRLSTVRDADQIVVMDGGLVVQRGTHRQLLADPDGLYHRLCLRQHGGALAEEPTDWGTAPPPESHPEAISRPRHLEAQTTHGRG
jgi:ABC-type multidrug transport system fused ATPase/permease subunit